jgi:hypothetical protein
MSFASNLTIADEVNAAKVFAENFRRDYKAARIVTTTTLAAPTAMVIDHFDTQVNKVPAVRHLVQFSKAAVDSNGVRSDTIVNLTITVPEIAVAGDPDELIGFLINFLIGTDAARTLANLDELLLKQS